MKKRFAILRRAASGSRQTNVSGDEDFMDEGTAPTHKLLYTGVHLRWRENVAKGGSGPECSGMACCLFSKVS